MSDVKWIKICTDIFDDEKIILLETLPDSDSIIIIWFKLLCLAGKQNNKGVFLLGNIPYTEEMLATYFRRPVKTVKLALKAFENFRMIEIVDNVITIPTWEKHQALDQLELSREQTRKRVAAYRERQKNLIESKEKADCNADVTLHVTECNTNVTQTDKEEEIDKEDKKKIKNRYKQLSLPQYLAYLLLNSGYDGLNELNICEYGKLFERWIDNHGVQDTKIKLMYFIKYNYKASNGDAIKNKFMYFRKSMENNFKMEIPKNNSDDTVIVTEEDIQNLLDQLKMEEGM